MTTFNEREKGFEAKFEREQELRFKAVNRRNKGLAQWAAELMGLTGEAAEDYGRAVIDAHLKDSSDDGVHDKVAADLEQRGVDLSDHRLRKKMDELFESALSELRENG